MERNCDTCGRLYEAKLATSKYCGGSCRVRASRGARSAAKSAPLVKLPARPAPVDAEPEAETPPGGLVQAVEAELSGVSRLDTVLGQAAVGLAQRIESNRDTGSALAALNRELRATVAEALKGAGAPQSAVSKHRDELAARRRA